MPAASAGFLLGLLFNPEDGGIIFARTTRRYVTEGCTLHSHRLENVKSSKLSIVFGLNVNIFILFVEKHK
jgi:hypothetical protein